MAKFGNKSMSQLVTTDQDIQTIMMEVIKWRDFSVIEGQRTAERQNHHWSKGRKLNGDPRKRADWEVIDSKLIVTTKDGYEKKSRHQGQPKSNAIDVVPYPEMWGNDQAFYELAGVIKATQERLLQEGKITKLLDWGADLWNGFDKPHWQIKQ